MVKSLLVVLVAFACGFGVSQSIPVYHNAADCDWACEVMEAQGFSLVDPEGRPVVNLQFVDQAGGVVPSWDTEAITDTECEEATGEAV